MGSTFSGTGASSARSTMSDLILTLRSLTSAGAAEYTVNAVTYWTDLQLQEVLDRHVYTVRHEELTPQPDTGVGGSVTYADYQSRRRFFEATSAGTARFIVRDEGGTALGTAAYTVDYPRGKVTLGTATTGLSRYLDGYSYDLNAAAADVWSQKASHYVTAYDFSTDNHSLKRSQIIQNCLLMAKEYGSGGAVRSVNVDRSDTDASDS